MNDRVHRGAQPPVTPHDDALQDFVQDVKAIYDLTDAEELQLLNTIGGFVNIVAVNALVHRPRPQQPTTAQGVQDGPELMRPEEVSVALGIPVSTLGGMRRAGRGPQFFKEGRTVLYRRDQVRAWLQEHVAVAGATPTNEAGPARRDSQGLLPQPSNTDPSEVRHDA